MGLVKFLIGPVKISSYLSEENHFKKMVSSTVYNWFLAVVDTLPFNLIQYVVNGEANKIK